MATLRSRNRTVAFATAGVVGAMIGLAFASAPLYRLFCQVTGYGGTPARVEASAAAIDGARVSIRFDSNVGDGLPWSFAPVVRAMDVRLGEESLAFFRARNQSDRPITGTAVFNVTPHKAGPYFAKIACFCFDEQTLAPGEDVLMPVSFYVDPAIAQDPAARDVTTITLSYTFYPSGGEKSPVSAAGGRGKPAG